MSQWQLQPPVTPHQGQYMYFFHFFLLSSSGSKTLFPKIPRPCFNQFPISSENQISLKGTGDNTKFSWALSWTWPYWPLIYFNFILVAIVILEMFPKLKMELTIRLKAHFLDWMFPQPAEGALTGNMLKLKYTNTD